MKHIANLLLITSSVVLISGCTSRTSNYNFGIKITEQPEYFSDHYGWRNPREYANTFKNINVYRDTLDIDINHNKLYPVDIEFLVDAIDYDVKVYPVIDSEKHLLTTMSVGFTNQVQISQTISIDGETLEPIAKYICVYDKKKDYYVPVLVSDNEYLSNEKTYRVVFVYKFPKGTYLKDFRKFWFKSGTMQIDFKLKDHAELNENLDFKIYWYRRSSMGERFLNIT